MSRPGAPSPGEEQALATAANMATKGPSYKYFWAKAEDAPGASTDFPIVAQTASPYDDVAQIKDTFAQEQMGENWVVPFTTEDAAYVKHKRDQAEKANFDDWVWNKYDLTDPAQNLMLQQIAPELYSRRQQLIDWNQDLASRYAKLRLRGAKNIEDLAFEWMIETGRVELPKGPVWDPASWRENQLQYTDAAGNRYGQDPARRRQINLNRYTYGFFSPLKWVTYASAGKGPDNNNPFDIRGTEPMPVAALQRYPNPEPNRATAKNVERGYWPSIIGPGDAAKRQRRVAQGVPDHQAIFGNQNLSVRNPADRP